MVATSEILLSFTENAILPPINKKPGRINPSGFLIRVCNPISEFLRARMGIIGFSAEFGREFGESLVNIHFYTVVLTALFVRGFEGAAIGGASEGEKLIKTVTETAQSSACAVGDTICKAGLAAICVRFTHDLLRDFDKSIEDVANGTSQLAT
jgi:hypothetical protein